MQNAQNAGGPRSYSEATGAGNTDTLCQQIVQRASAIEGFPVDRYLGQVLNAIPTVAPFLRDDPSWDLTKVLRHAEMHAGT